MVQEQTQVLTGGVAMTIAQKDTIGNFAGAYFDTILEHSISVQNQITDNWLENNTAVQDHIAHSPIIVTLRGLIGECTYVPNDLDRNNALKGAQQETKLSPLNKLSQLEFLLPPVSNAMQVARNINDYVTASIDRYKAVWTSFNNRNGVELDAMTATAHNAPKLKGIFNILLELRNNNASFTVETPFKKFENMYIQSLSFRQGNENYVGDISITLKELRFTDVEKTKADEKVMAKYNAYARAKEQNNGKAQGKQVSNSALYNTLTPNAAYTNR